MNIDLPDTSSAEISRALQRIHEESAQTTGRVLTLLVHAEADEDVDGIREITTGASREHPSRVIVVIKGGWAPRPRVDAQVSFGGETGASELVVIRLRGEVAKHRASVVTPLLLPDTPIVTWWPGSTPEDPGAGPLGRLAQRRITDVRHSRSTADLATLRANYRPGDTDLAWARITQWRGIVAGALDVYPRQPVRAASLYGAAGNPSMDLAAGWLAERLRCPVERAPVEHAPAGHAPAPGALTVLRLHREGGDTILAAHDDATVRMSIPGHPESTVTLGRRSRTDCLAEELRHLDPDPAYAGALRGLAEVTWKEQ